MDNTVMADLVVKDAAWVFLKLRPLWPLQLELVDTKYQVPSLDYFLGAALADLIDQKPYVPEFMDCDDFALWFKAICSITYGITSVGLVRDYSSKHGYNVVVFQAGNIMLWEPQTDSLVFLSTRNRKHYGLKFGRILV